MGEPCVVKKCCCCIELRVGAIIIAVLQIVGAIGYIAKYHQAGDWAPILSSICGILAGVALLLGAIKYWQCATIVNLVYGMLSIVCYVIAAIMFVMMPTMYSYHDAQIAVPFYIAGAIYIIVAGINLLFWIYVFSFLKGMKKGEISAV